MTGTRRMWAIQAPVVRETIERDGRCVVKKHYLREKYGDLFWIFDTAYSFIGREMERIIERPEGAESPIWVYEDMGYPQGDAASELLELRVPEDKLLIFDARDWEKILGLSYLGTEEECRSFKEELLRQGIQDSTDVFRNPFYPALRRRITDSWRAILKNECTEPFYRAGAVWEIQSDWLISAGKLDGEKSEGDV